MNSGMLITSARSTVKFLPIYDPQVAFTSGGLLLDIDEFLNIINLNKYTVYNNSRSYKNYVPMISYETHFPCCDVIKPYSEACSRISCEKSKKKPKAVVDLDEISPAEVKDVLDHFPETLGAELESNELVQECKVLLLKNVFDKHGKSKERVDQLEHNKVVRMTIFYTLSFFALIFVTFFTIYLA